METEETWQNLKERTKRRDKRRKRILQGTIVLAICAVCKFDCYAATVSETEVLEIFESSALETLETEEPCLLPMQANEESEEKISDIVEEQKRREEERLQKEAELQREREKAKAEERQEARMQAIAEEEKRKEEERAEEEAKEKAEKEKYLYLLPEADFLGQVIETEAAKSWEDRRRVGSVVLNRVRTTYEDFRDVHTIKEVFFQGNQYNDDSKKKIAEGIEATPEAIEVAYGLITGEIPCLEEEILFQSRNEKDWMPGRLKRADLPEQEQYYGIPLDFKERCLPES